MKKIFFLLFTTLSLYGFAQGEASNWYFGNGAGLVFDLATGDATPNSNAQGTINTNEGCSTISDSSGNLLFYTDGRNVWNRNFQLMPNADYDAGIGLLGDPSSTSSGLIVPKPGNSDQYYIFTVDEPHHDNASVYPNQYTGVYTDGGTIPLSDDGFNNGFAYSLVDMTLDGGLGDVVSTEKNVQLVTYDITSDEQAAHKCAEKITAVEHADENSYWVLTQFIDTFYAFRVDSNGVNTTPIASQVNPAISISGYRRNAIGYLKSSPDGSMVAICHTENGTVAGGSAPDSGSLYLYEFDNATGIVSNPLLMLDNTATYGVDFSADSQKLYASARNGSFSSVIQFDLSNNNAQTQVFGDNSFIGAIQLAPNGKIYLTNSLDPNFLDVIENPEETGIGCNYVINGQPLDVGTTARLGLPPFIQSFLLANINVENLCFGDTTMFSIDSSEAIIDILWDFGDTTTSTDENPSYIYSTAGDFAVSVTVTTASETKTFTRNITIYETPEAFQPNDIDICDDDNDGFSSFNLEDLNTEILNGQSDTTFSVHYFLNQTDADNFENEIIGVFDNTSNPQQLIARVNNAANTECYETIAFNFEVFDTPTANPVDDVELCDNDIDDGDETNGQLTFDLFSLNSSILDSQDATLYTISYHNSQANADAGANDLPQNYYNLTPFGETIYVRIENSANESCFDTTSFNLIVYPTPTANAAADIDECDSNNDGSVSLDYNALVDSQVLLAQDATVFNVTYYATLNDAENGTNQLIMPHETTSNPQEIFAKISHNVNNSCFDISSFIVNSYTTPTANSVQDQVLCDNDDDGDDTNGQIEIDLLQFNTFVLDGQDATLYTISYHANQVDANSNSNPLPQFYTNTLPNEEIFVRVENSANTNCFDTTSFNFTVNNLPDFFNSSLFQCDEDGLPDGFTLFNLTEAFDDLTGGINGVSAKYYLTLNDAENSVNEIDGNSFSNFQNPQIIYTQIIDDVTGCFSIAELELEVSATDANDASLVLCDDDGAEDGIQNFTLSEADVQVLNGLPAGITLAYYETYQDALLEINELGNTYTNIQPYNQTIFVRAENDNACYGINEVSLIVNVLPDLEPDETILYCLNFFPDLITLSGGVIGDLPNNYLYEWSTGATTTEIQVNQPGTYSVIVTNVLGCSKTRTITVVPSNIATIDNIEIEDGGETGTVTILVSGEGDYEYALDDINGPYQNNNTFTNVEPGFHTVYVRDKNNCGIVEELLSVIGFPKFFTPNGDTFFDTWQVYGVGEQFQANSKIRIFDRFGKLLKEVDPSGAGWDGTFNGKVMPSTDYWFQVTLEDGRVYKNHFALRR